MAAIEKTERQIAVLKLRSAKRNLARATSKAEALKVEWTGTQTPEWSRYITAQGKMNGFQHVVKSLSALLDADQPSAYSVRNIGFDDNGALQVDGDWVADLSGNGEEMCIECAAKALLAGELSREDLHVCYSYIQDVEYAITCSECKTMIRLGAYAYVVCEVPNDYSADDEDPSDWEYSPGSPTEGVIAWYPDGEEAHAIAHMTRLASENPSERYQVRYIDVTGDSYNNSIYADSADLIVDA